MVLPSIFSRKHSGKRRGSSVPEYVIAVGIGTIIGVFTITLVVHSGRTFASLANYADLNSSSINAIDRMTREIRNSAGLASFSPQKIVLDTGTNQPTITYTYLAADESVTRQEGTNPVSVILTGCDSLDFFIYEPYVASNTLALPVTTVPADAKAVGVNWTCSRTILGHKVNKDSPKTAVIVMRRP